MAWIVDSLRGALSAIGARTRFSAASTALPNLFTHQLALAAYMSSGMLRKVIAIPADDRVREWRDWQVEEDEITKIEAEEKRLAVQAKFKELEVMRGTGGGALLLITAGNHASELKPEQIAEGGLVAINVVSRWQLRGLEWVRDLASPDYGTPRMWELSGDAGPATKMHPSRVICFRGAPVPAGPAIDIEERFWGDSALLRVYKEVERSDDTQAAIAALVKKAKLTRIGIPNLEEFDDKKIAARVALIAEGEGILNATVYRSPGANGDAGETITDYQITWTGIPDVMDAFDQRVAAVADIPFTRLMGRSPAGMNATGDHDTDNWNKMVASGQLLETKPCLEKLDPILLRSAGAKDPDKAWWVWSPLDTPTEKEIADTFKTITEAVQNLINAGVAPSVALAEAVQNLIEERGYLPGLAQALKKIPESERYGSEPVPTDEELDGDPSAIAGGGKRPPVGRKVVTTDAAPRTLYVQRKLLNGGDLIAWAKAQGFETTTPADELHVTIAFSRQPVDWMKIPQGWYGEENGQFVVPAGGARIVEPLGNKGAVVLLFNSSMLSWRHEEINRAGASYDFAEYQPHVTITYQKPADLDLSTVKPFVGALKFGPELFSEVQDDWEKTVTEA